jgi:asparagine synthase (glutamine-hydrolysing)
LLDPDIIRFAWSLPDELKTRGKERKALLRAVLGRYVPRALWDRPKQGFGIPAADWLRGPFRELASDLFSTARLERQGLLETSLVQAIWADFLAGGQRRVNLIWTLFIAQLYIDAEEKQS